MLNFLKKIATWINKDSLAIKSFKEGRDKRIQGVNYSKNPYLPGTKEHKWWESGWYAVNERLSKG